MGDRSPLHRDGRGTLILTRNYRTKVAYPCENAVPTFLGERDDLMCREKLLRRRGVLAKKISSPLI
jgi:hypothetical protein